MKIITSAKELQTMTLNLRNENQTIGFVPTMGFLHEGHLALLKEARRTNDILILSIFVNPLQFGPNEDFESYPRDLDRDKEVALEAGVDYIFHPTVKDMFPQEPSVTVKVHSRTDVLCGRSRPGHFDGVATVLTKLFHLVQPTNVYFGKKDAQQVAVVSSLIEEFQFPIRLIAVNTVREEDGLAKSSRNVRLSPEERKEAGILYRVLAEAREELIKKNQDVEEIMQNSIRKIEFQSSGKVDYFEILTYPELQHVHQLKGTFIVAVAVHFDHARLIDNIIFEL